MNNDILILIKTINDNYSHINELETLEHLLKDHDLDNIDPKGERLWFGDLNKEYIVAMTTHNSHYDYKLFTDPQFQNPDNHVDKILGPNTYVKSYKQMYFDLLTKG